MTTDDILYQKRARVLEAIARIVDEIERGWKQSESHRPQKWIELSGLSGIVSVSELAAFLGAGPATAHQYARALSALCELEGASADDRRKADAAKAEAARQAEEARKAEAARQAEEARKAEAARQAERARKAEVARRAKESRRRRFAIAAWATIALGILTWGLLPVMVTTERQADPGRLVDTQPPQGRRAPIDNTPPRVFSIRLVQNWQPTVSDVIWHVIFSEPVRNVSQNGADFRISETDAAITVRQVGDIGRRRSS